MRKGENVELEQQQSHVVSEFGRDLQVRLELESQRKIGEETGGIKCQKGSVVKSGGRINETHRQREITVTNAGNIEQLFNSHFLEYDPVSVHGEIDVRVLDQF